MPLRSHPPPPPARRAASHEVFRPRHCALSGSRLTERYLVVGLLGEGGTSEVYLAEDRELNALVIVKLLKSEVVEAGEVRRRFLAEARATMAVSHPGVVRVLGVEEPVGGRPFLVIEALVGESLGDFLRREAAVPPDLVLVLARQAVAGLEAAHQVGVVHRDIKPDNLFLLGPLGAPNGLKIIDFGHAKDLKRGAQSSTNMVVGTAQYMPPEQVLCDPVDARTDVYALGVVLFRMLTGQLPFDGVPGVDLLSHQLFSPAPPLSWLAESIEPRLEAIVMRALRKHPDNRYPSMRELSADLDLLLGGDHNLAGDLPLVPLARFPDVYRPQNPKGREVAALLAARFGADLPPPSSRAIAAPRR